MEPSEFSTDIPLKGEVCKQFIRCNKTGCRCREGRTHGPYYYRVWREGGRIRKEYVKPENVAATRAACDAYRALQMNLRVLRRQREQLSLAIRREWRRTQRLLRSCTPGSPGVSVAAAPPTPPQTGL